MGGEGQCVCMMIYIIHKVHLYDDIHQRFKDDCMMIYISYKRRGCIDTERFGDQNQCVTAVSFRGSLRGVKDMQLQYHISTYLYIFAACVGVMYSGE